MWQQLNQGSRPLAMTGAVMLVVLAAAAVGLAVDPRLVSGMPVWLKPAKFAASIAIYAWTLAWIFTRIPDWSRTRRVVEWMTTITMVVEMAIIATQAARGTTSHFNVATRVDGVMFFVMGALIVMQTLTSSAVAVALWRQPFADRALGWGLRLGMTITIAGAAAGGVMTRPTGDQLARVREGRPMTVAGAHTVGAPDGGPGLPGTGWSREHGDLRIAHFVGLHALQALPFVAIALRRKRISDYVRVRLTLVAAASYFSLMVILMWQALRGQSIAAPDLTTIFVLAIWGSGSFGVASAVATEPLLNPSLVTA